MSDAELKGQRAEAIVESLSNMDGDMSSVDSKLVTTNEKLTSIDNSASSVDSKLDATNEKLTSIDTKLGGTIDVAIQDQHTPIVCLRFTKDIQALTVFQPVAVGSSTIIVDAAISPVADNVINILDSTHIDQALIVSVTAENGHYTVVIDTPLSSPLTVNSVVTEGSYHMEVNGSVTPVVFSVSMDSRLSSIAFDITQILLLVLDASTMDDSLFGGIPALTKGVVFRKVENGNTFNICNIKSNGEFNSTFGNANYHTKAPSGSYGLSTVLTMQTLAGVGVVSRLTTTPTSTLEILIQDDLMGLSHFHAKATGHVVLD